MDDFDKAAWAQQKNEERAQAFEILNEFTQKVASGELLQKYLEMQSRLDKYSTSNVMLIAAQDEGATKLKSYADWKKSGQKVNRDAPPIFILEPGKAYTDKKGKQVTPYNAKKVYDIANTDGKAEEKADVHYDTRFLLKAMIENSDVKIVPVEELDSPAGALYNHEEQITRVKKGIDISQCFKAVAQELSFAQLAKMYKVHDREQHGPQAEYAAYMLCKKHGIDTADFKLTPFPPQIAEETPARVRSYLSDARTAMVNIHDRMENNLHKTKKAQEAQR